ncbi:unnamed protein product, partial [Amoebophrya sp. A120]
VFHEDPEAAAVPYSSGTSCTGDAPQIQRQQVFISEPSNAAVAAPFPLPGGPGPRDENNFAQADQQNLVVKGPPRGRGDDRGRRGKGANKDPWQNVKIQIVPRTSTSDPVDKDN